VSAPPASPDNWQVATCGPVSTGRTYRILLSNP